MVEVKGLKLSIRQNYNGDGWFLCVNGIEQDDKEFRLLWRNFKGWDECFSHASSIMEFSENLKLNMENVEIEIERTTSE